MEPVSEMSDSRAATNRLLAELREGDAAPAAVVRFLAHAARRSLAQAARRPRALAELTALHGVMYALAGGRRPGRGWVTASWVLAASHLGLLEQHSRLSAADLLTLTRAGLPALPGGACQAGGLVAIGLDIADGRLARRQGTVSPFGQYADTFADAAFWTWLTLRHEPSRTARAAAVAVWLLPVAALQVVIAIRHLTRPGEGQASLLPEGAVPGPGCRRF